MRPRVFPAEDVTDAREYERALRRASMRPRVFPAEDMDDGRLKRWELRLQ